jgi:hypothetical protein
LPMATKPRPASQDRARIALDRRAADDPAMILACAPTALGSNTSFMRISLPNFAVMITLSLVGSAFGASSSYPVVQPDPQALAVASKWLSVVDAGNYAESYAMLAPRIRSGGFEKNWVGHLRVKRAPLGRLLSRKFVKAQFARTLPGAPDGYYEFFTYSTSFARKAQAAELVVLTKESGHWQVSGYQLR